MSDTLATRQSPAYSPMEEIPFNLYKPADPLSVKVIESTKLTAPDSPNDVRHVVLDFSGSNYRYWDGQSAGILPPGMDEKGKAHKIRLYSIASPSTGEGGKPQTLSLCVKRVVYTDPETGEERRGVCSNYLCDLKVGDTVNVTGPAGKAFLLPEVPNAHMIMVATGTGIAPFRAFLQTRYNGSRRGETGQSWLFFGAQYRSDYLYGEELEGFCAHPGYHLVTAFSREEKTADGRKMYVQDRIAEYGAQIIDLLQQPNTYFYICGLKGMETGILEALAQACAAKGLDWTTLLNQLNAEKRWRVEVY